MLPDWIYPIPFSTRIFLPKYSRSISGFVICFIPQDRLFLVLSKMYFEMQHFGDSNTTKEQLWELGVNWSTGLTQLY